MMNGWHRDATGWFLERDGRAIAGISAADAAALADAALDRLILAADKEKRRRSYRRFLETQPYSPLAALCRGEGMTVPTPAELTLWDARR